MKAIFCSIVIFFLPSCALLSTWQLEYPDNAIESYWEDVIEDYLNLPDDSLDLSPFTGTETVFD